MASENFYITHHSYCQVEQLCDGNVIKAMGCQRRCIDRGVWHCVKCAIIGVLRWRAPVGIAA